MSEPRAPSPNDEVSVYFNPRCSKCREAKALLEQHGAAARYIHYLDEKPSRVDLERLMNLLELADPRAMMRTKDPIYQELDLASADRERLLDALVANPSLLERPIVVRGERAVIARPSERLLALLGDR